MLKSGQVFNNRYKIISTLGQGGFGAVYKVWDDNLQRHCAIKENLQVSAEAQKQFKREAIMLANLNHPHLVRVTDYFFISDRGQYLVMDFVDGIDLQTALINYGKALPFADTLKWTLQICDALIYIHNRNPPIIHGDIKPANIRITPQNNAVLVDFGLAKAFEANAKTSTGARELTPYFASPEQYDAGGTDAQSDIYSLGVTLYCMLTNHVPADSVDIMVGNAEPPPPAKSINNDIPEFVSDALQRAMQIRRTDRYRLVVDFKTALLAEQKSFAQVKVVEPTAVQAANLTNNKLTLPNGMELIDQSLEINQRDSRAWNIKGNTLIRLRRYEEAIRCYDIALDINQHDGFAWLNKGVCLTKLRRYEEAIPCFDKAQEIDSRDGTAWFHKGMSFFGLRRDEEAIRCFEKALEFDPRNSIAWKNKGVSLRALERYEEAIRCYDKALEVDPRDGAALNDKGDTLASLGRYEEAIRCYDKALEVDPRDGTALIDKGDTLASLGRYEEAIRCYDKALEIDPRDAGALNTKGRLLVDLERYEEAIHYCDKALEIDPRNGDAWANKGVSLDSLGQRREAAQAYRQFIALASAQDAERIEFARQRIRELEGK